jgi:nucleotide-binding universal stress UspA family protein
MFEKILYATDFSEVSKKALDYVKQLKDAGTKEVVVLHVIDIGEFASTALDEGGALDIKKLERDMDEYTTREMGQIETELRKSGLNVKLRIERGVPLRVILRVEEEEDVSVVVLGSHGKGLVQEIFLGSVSEGIIRRSKRPVLVIRR